MDLKSICANTMSTCGYICPKCEGKNFTDDGEVCDWCNTEEKISEEKNSEDFNQIIKSDKE